MTTLKTQKMIDCSAENDIALMEKICHAACADVLFKAPKLLGLPVQLARVKEPVCFRSRGRILMAKPGEYVAAYKTPSGISGSYYLAVLKTPLIAHQLCRTYCQRMTQGDAAKQTLFSLPFVEEISRVNPQALVSSDIKESANFSIQKIRTSQALSYKVGSTVYSHKANTYVPVLNGREVERMSMYYYKTASKVREIDEILFALPTAKVWARSVDGLVLSKKARALAKPSEKIKSILRICEDTSVVVMGTQNPHQKLPLKLVRGQTIALVKNDATDTLTLCEILPEDLHDLTLKARYCARLARVNVLALHAREGLNTILGRRKKKENQRN